MRPTVDVQPSELDMSEFIKRYQKYVPDLSRMFPGQFEAMQFEQRHGEHLMPSKYPPLDDEEDEIPMIRDDWEEEEALYQAVAGNPETGGVEIPPQLAWNNQGISPPTPPGQIEYDGKRS